MAIRAGGARNAAHLHATHLALKGVSPSAVRGQQHALELRGKGRWRRRMVWRHECRVVYEGGHDSPGTGTPHLQHGQAAEEAP